MLIFFYIFLNIRYFCYLKNLLFINLNTYKTQIVKHNVILQKLNLFCNKFNNYKNFTIDNNNYICAECGLELGEIQNLFSYNAVNRVNITSKYTYDRKIHFRDCLNQFQGKQVGEGCRVCLQYTRVSTPHIDVSGSPALGPSRSG